MENKKTQLRKRAEACKKAERKYVTVWKMLTVATLILALVVSACSVALSMKGSTTETVGNGSWQIVGKDPDAIYYSLNYSSEAERLQAGKELSYHVAAEGSVLLTNNGALPLADGAKVSLSAAPEGLQAALEGDGLTVSDADADALILTVTRAALEKTPEPSYLLLNEQEKTMLADAAKLKAEGKVKSVILLLATAYPMQMDFLKGNDTVDACLWIGDVGASGIGAVADILAGLVSPSGRLTDTYCYDIFSAPAMKNAQPVAYSGAEESATHLVYQEGIYVGYKYYETRYEDYVMVDDNAGEYHYDEVVAFPFGHGLSYTTFEYSDLVAGYNESTDQYEIFFVVMNTGEVASMETVQVYAQTPYTDYDIRYGVEKPAVSLVAFTKTGLLQPGETREIVISIDRRELAAFDAGGSGSYILDAGDYYLTLAKDAHAAVNNILVQKGYDQLEERMDAPGDIFMTYHWTEKTMDTISYAQSAGEVPIQSQLAESDPNLYEGTRGDDPREKTVTWLSRNNWKGTFPADEPISLQLTQLPNEPADKGAAQLPEMGTDKEIKLQQLRNKEYQNPMWSSFLDQLTFADMIDLIAESIYQNAGDSSVKGTVFPSENMLAATFNRDLCYTVGQIKGNDAMAAETPFVEGPVANVHRTPLSDGYSEDAYLTGEICTMQMFGYGEEGVNAAVRYLGFNEPSGAGVWVSEQAAREIYLKGFQKVVGNAEIKNVEISDARLGGVWAGSSEELMRGILEAEWGYTGAVMANPDTSVVDGLLAGTTVFAATSEELTAALQDYANDPVIVSALREACHRNLYMVVNSAAMNGIGADTVIQRKGEQQEAQKLNTVYILVPAIFWVLPIVAFILWQRGKKLWVNTEEYKNYISLLENQKK